MLTKQRTQTNGSGIFKTILWAGCLVGLLDILAAMIMYYAGTQKNPLDVLPFIASGVFGKRAFNGETRMIVWGFLFHFLIAYAFTIFFFIIFPKIKFLHRNKIFTAVIMGIFIWCVMNLIVLPLSNTPKLPFHFVNALRGAVVLIIAIGLPLSFIAHHYYKRKKLTTISG